jgi:hypothetical protein
LWGTPIYDEELVRSLAIVPKVSVSVFACFLEIPPSDDRDRRGVIERPSLTHDSNFSVSFFKPFLLRLYPSGGLLDEIPVLSTRELSLRDVCGWERNMKIHTRGV